MDVIPVDQIDFVQAQDDYVAYVARGRQYLKEQTLAEVEASLDPARFVRVHRSYVVNVERVTRVDLDERENRVALLTTGDRVPVSRSGHARLTARLGGSGPGGREGQEGRKGGTDIYVVPGFSRALSRPT